MFLERAKGILRESAPRAFYGLRNLNRARLRRKYRRIFKDFTHGHFVEIPDAFGPFSIYIEPDNGSVGIDNHIYLDHVWEIDITRLFKKLIKDNDTVLDIGANIGYHSLLAARLVGENGHVHSFEPITKMRVQFEKSIRKNNFKNIQVHPYACGNSEERLKIYFRDDNTGGSSLVPAVKDQYHDDLFEEVSVKKLDDFNIQDIALIKIDVEGYEYETLLGARQILADQRPILVLEFSPYLYNAIDPKLSQKILDLLVEYNYVFSEVSQSFSSDKYEKLKQKLPTIRQVDLLCIPSEKIKGFV